MGKSIGPRVIRGREPKGVLRLSTLGKAKAALMRDFKERCAYSMQHWKRAGGTRCMEIDHFDPRSKRDPTQRYENLMLATRHCNGAKSDTWPTESEQKAGIRFLNPCVESDYGTHIVEDISTGELIGLTPAGCFQVEMCDLNASHLSVERQRRTRIIALLRLRLPRTRSLRAQVAKSRRYLREELRDMIPRIPPWDIANGGNVGV